MECLHFTMIYARDATSGELTVDNSRFTDASEVVRDLVHQAVENLDCLHLARAMVE